MKLYQYLNESRSKELKEEQFNELLQKNCSDILQKYKQKNDLILRGAKQLFTYGYVNPLTSSRTSAYADFNFYTILMDELLPSWKNMPKRSKSVIATNNENKAGEYGNVFIIYPYNGSKIGICDDADIWDGFPYLDLTPLNELNWFLDDMCDVFNIKNNNDKQTLIKLFNEIDDLNYEELMEKLYNTKSNRNEDFIRSYLHSSEDEFIVFLDNQMNPNKNKFKSLTTKNYSLKDDSNEIWIEGECILERFTNDRYNQLREK